MKDWWPAFLLTQAIEVPLYLWAGWKVPAVRRCAAAVGASCLTHPWLWFCLPWDEAHYVRSMIFGESMVVLAEAIVLRIAGFARPLLTSLMVNAASAGIGLLIAAWLRD